MIVIDFVLDTGSKNNHKNIYIFGDMFVLANVADVLWSTGETVWSSDLIIGFVSFLAFHWEICNYFSSSYKLNVINVSTCCTLTKDYLYSCHCVILLTWFTLTEQEICCNSTHKYTVCTNIHTYMHISICKNIHTCIIVVCSYCVYNVKSL